MSSAGTYEVDCRANPSEDKLLGDGLLEYLDEPAPALCVPSALELALRLFVPSCVVIIVPVIVLFEVLLLDAPGPELLLF